MPLKSYSDDRRVIARKARYKDIADWIKEKYGVHVRNVDISRAKQRCGLACMELDHKASPGYKPPKSRPEREDMVIEAFRHFGIIPEN